MYCLALLIFSLFEFKNVTRTTRQHRHMLPRHSCMPWRRTTTHTSRQYLLSDRGKDENFPPVPLEKVLADQ